MLQNSVLFFMFSLMCSVTYSQSIERSVISSVGFSYTSSTLQTDCTIGEVITFSGEGSENTLTQGFHQPLAIVALCQTPHVETIEASACSTYELNGETYTIAGSYTQMLLAEDGCDSIIYLNLQLNTLSNQVAIIENTLIATQENASYAWTLCGEEIIQSTSQVFTPIENGEYQVTITQEDCEVVSECVSFTIGIEYEIRYVDLSVFPNPTHENLQLEVNGSSKRFTLSIYDSMGKMVLTETISSPKTNLSVGHFSNGTYVIVLRSDFSIFTKSFVKS
ncbi:MAG: T9SS type A sorting domain-containing protein [Flavobacteriales bacterium]